MATAIMDIKPGDLPPMGPGKIVSYKSRYCEMLIAEKVKESNIPGLGLPPGEAPKPKVAGEKLESVIPKKYSEGASLNDHPICIIGAGMSGLYAAMILQSLNLNFEILEASPRIGGRAFTHRFSETTSFHDYFDVGAMRFPQSQIMDRTFDLMQRVGLGDVNNEKDRGKLIPYKMTADNTIRMYNGIRVVGSKTREDQGGAHDMFGFEIKPEYRKYQFPEMHIPEGEWLTGAPALLEAAINPFKKALVKDFKSGWTLLMHLDSVPLRVYLQHIFEDPTKNKDGKTLTAEEIISRSVLPNQGLPAEVVQWIETLNNSSGSFDRGFSDCVLGDLDFSMVDEYGNLVDTDWWCINGGIETLADACVKHLVRTYRNEVGTYDNDEDAAKKLIFRNRRVTAIIQHPNDKCHSNVLNPLMGITVQDYPEYEDKRYSHIITTVPFPCLRSMDLSKAGLSVKQSEAVRCLTYGPSVKIGIKFKQRWWENMTEVNIKGGLSKTDYPVRTVVYPSYTVGDPKDSPGFLMASYAWTQDSARLGALCQGKGTKAEAHLLDIVYRDLTTLHSTEDNVIDPAWLKSMTLDYYAHDFYHNEFTMGAFAYFTPGQFSKLYPEITKPAALGNLHLAGEAASTHHAWIVRALDSAWRAVFEILDKEKDDKRIEQLVDKWGVPEEYPLYAANAQVMRGIESSTPVEEKKD